MRISDLPLMLLYEMEGPEPPADFVSDGCSCVFDRWFAVDCRPACLYHDFAYSIPGDAKARREADAAFYRNLRRCDLGKFVATIRWLGVRIFGGRHFNWTDK